MIIYTFLILLLFYNFRLGYYKNSKSATSHTVKILYPWNHTQEISINDGACLDHKLNNLYQFTPCNASTCNLLWSLMILKKQYWLHFYTQSLKKRQCFIVHAHVYLQILLFVCVCVCVSEYWYWALVSVSYRVNDNCFKSGHQLVNSLYLRSWWLLFSRIFYTVQIYMKMHLYSYNIMLKFCISICMITCFYYWNRNKIYIAYSVYIQY